MSGMGAWAKEVHIICVGMAVAATMLVYPVDGGAAFHSGNGNCDGCHGKQVRAEGQPELPASAAMLKGADASSTCLLCHEAPVAGLKEQHHVSTPGAALGPGVPPRQLTPGGDFGWLKKNYSWMPGEVGAGVQTSPGERHGHNIVAADFNYRSDTTHGRAPGGDYPSASLSCISCHDPHGTSSGSVTGQGGYRLLGGIGYQPKSDPAIAPFTDQAPAAVAPAEYNRAETSGSTRVAYGSGMSEWCRNCHKYVHGGGGFGHPAGNEAKLDGTMVAGYNAYVGSGNLNGSSAGSYTSLVPFEMGTADYAVLKNAAATGNAHGPDAGSGTPNVMCLTCHRAHASGWDSMTRWNTGATFMVQNGRYSGTDAADANDSAHGRTFAETARAYYDRRPDSFALYQRSLCNKCHVKD